MGLTQLFPDGSIAGQVALFQKRLEEATIFALQYLGEQLAMYAKDNHTYTDQTGNLTNSISYAVARDKEIIYFDGPGQQGGLSKEDALKIAQQMINESSNRFTLVIVAGMNYAAAVESKGYNVILPAELKAKTEFPKVMKRLQDKATAKAQAMFGIAL